MRKISLNILLIITLICGSLLPSLAQKSIGNLFSSNLERGDEAYDDFYYEEAIKYYTLALKKDESNSSINIKIADSYRMINDYQSSAEWYGRVLNDSISYGKPIDQYHYAETLLSNGKTQEAEVWFKKYYMSAPTDSRSFRKFDNIGSISRLYSDSSLMTVDKNLVNTEFDDLSAIKYQDGFVFLSSNKSNGLVDDDFLREEGPLNLYYAKVSSSGDWQEVEIFDKAINTSYHEGPIAFYAKQEKLILTRSNNLDGKPIKSKDGDTKLQLYDVSKQDGAWSNVRPLSFNDPQYSFAHPSLSANNDTLYFASDMDGGYGGSDIYMSIKHEGAWSEPKNMGFQVNTEGDEMYPFILENRLFFSSNGFVGLGGMDIYKAFISNREVQKIVNLGYPINSPQDDFAYFLDKKSLTGTLSSNRVGGKGETDIYLFNYEAQVLSGLVTDDLDGTKIFGALVKLIEKGIVVDSIYSDENGLFSFYLPLTSDFELEVSKDEHFASIPVAVASRQGAIDLDTVRISLHKHDLFAEGRVLNNETQQLMKDVRLTIYNTTDSSVDTLITNEKGTYSFVLKPDKNYSIYAGKSGFLVNGVDINTMQIARGAILNDIVLELEYSKKEVIRFDYDKYAIKTESITALKRTARAMKNTQNELVISAYADARGTVEYNQKLSDKRAKAVLDYLVSQGVPKSRIVARGFGETLLLNRCTDGVHCEEIEHSTNRRAEIKIEGSTVR